ncbi:MAG: hypothetical protein FWF85_03740 [Clostridiales bacterium]|nr:hypothetical protein [Clostridiales bacterium]
MRRIIIFFLAGIIFFLPFAGTQATDLPIDIYSIGLQSGYDDAFTARYNVDLFSANAQIVNDAMARQAQLKREAALAYLFETGDSKGTADAKQQISLEANSHTLFSRPVNYSAASKAIDPASMPVWLMILLFIACSGGGFIGARISAARRREEKTGVY